MRRLRTILVLARHTGRRESAICNLRASDLLLTPERMRGALAAEGMDERLAEHMPHGAIRWAAEHDKQGLLFITPISAETRRELDRYIRQHPRMGNVPLFPAPGPRRKKGAPPRSGLEKPVSRETAARWLLRAEKAAELPKLTGGVFHPYRRLFASERRHLPDLDVATAAGWKDPATMRRAYQQTDPAAVLRAVNHGI
jgi:integrase